MFKFDLFKFDLKQVVWYILNNEIHSAPIFSRMIVENFYDDWAVTKEQKESFQCFGPSVIKYSTCHGQFVQEDLFESKELLTDKLNGKI